MVVDFDAVKKDNGCGKFGPRKFSIATYNYRISSENYFLVCPDSSTH
jgi:hypothetical protein